MDGNIDCGDCDCGGGDCGCDCCSGGDCCGDCCCCFICIDTHSCGGTAGDCCVACSCNPSTTKCCCRLITTLAAIAVATLIVVLITAYAVAFPARVTVEDAYLRRFALTNGTTSLAYDVSLTIAVRNRNFAPGGVWRTAPLVAELRFHGQTFARATAQLESAKSPGIFKAQGGGVYRVTAAADGAPPAVALVGDAVVTEFVRESVAGVFEIELVVVGGEVMDEEHRHGSDSSVRVTCPLKLSLPTATAPVVSSFTTVKCTTS